MYVVRRWDEENIKWLAVAMCLAMVGLMVMHLAVGKAGYLIDQWINSLPNSDKIPYTVKYLASGLGSYVFGNTASILVRLALMYAGYGAAAGPVGAIVGLGVGLL